MTNRVRFRRSEVEEYLCQPVKNIKDPLKWWVANCHVYPNLSRMALDYLSIPGKLLFITISCHVTKFPPIATSTAVERVFSQGRQLLSFTHNCLSASSICAYLCLGSWGRNDLIYFEDVLAAVKGNAKRKWEKYDSEVEVVEYE